LPAHARVLDLRGHVADPEGDRRRAHPRAAEESLMDLELTPEQQELRSLAAELLERRVPREAVREFFEGRGDTSSLWSELAELGWYGVGLDEDDAFGVPGLTVLAEQIGRRLAPTVLVDVAAAARIVPTWRERLIDGKATVSLALTDGDETVASRDRSGGVR